MNFYSTFKYLYFTKVCKGNKYIYDFKKAVLLLFGAILFMVLVNYYNFFDKYLLLGLSVLVITSFSFIVLSSSLDKSTYKVLETIPVHKRTIALAIYLVDFVYFLLTFYLMQKIKVFLCIKKWCFVV